MTRIARHDYLEAPGSPGTHGHSDRVLVVVFLRGGADGLTLVPPVGDDNYYRARPVLAVKKADAIDLDGSFALNASLRPLMKHFESGSMSIVHGAGSEDTTRSHFEAQDFMEHGGPSGGGGGWLGRYLRARSPAAGAPSALAAVAIGTTLPESLRGAPVGAVMQTLRDFSVGDDDDSFMSDLGRLYEAQAGPLGQAAHDTIQAVRRLREIRAASEGNSRGVGAGAYPDSQFGRGLREMARLIRADVGLVASTIDLDGWDTHFLQQQIISPLMAELAGGLDAFWSDLGEHRQRVDIVTMTEFGRRVHENTSFGTDHGSGSVMFVLGEGWSSAGGGAAAGGAARTGGGGGGGGGGGQIRRGFAGLADDRLIGPGDIPASINFRDVLGPILQRHSAGIDLRRVFPGYEFAPLNSVGAADLEADHGGRGHLRGCTCSISVA